MTAREIRWVPTTVGGPAARSLRSFSIQGASKAETVREAASHIELPDLSEYATPLAKARLLLDTAAEIEHALMTQYLYAAYSLKSHQDSTLTVPQRSAVRSWRQTVAQVAREEMGHLMTVQNLLLLIKQPPNMEREDFPPRKQLYPFAMNLEPLTQRSLAKYVVTESPHDASDIEDIVELATQSGADLINRVGILYAILGVVFSRHEDLETNASKGDWYENVRDVANCLYETFKDQTISEWHLTDDSFDPASVMRQADQDTWGDRSVSVFKAVNRETALIALEDISVQGEGMSKAPDSGVEESHFIRFKKMFRGIDGSVLPFPTPSEWVPTKEVPTNPKVVSVAATLNDIVATPATLWSDVADRRYGMLLGLLQHYFVASTAGRAAIANWSVYGGMIPLRAISDILVNLPRQAIGSGVAALPFTLPEVINLPSEHASQVALIKRRLTRSINEINALIASGAAQSVLPDMLAADSELLQFFQSESPAEDDADGEPKSDPTSAETQMIELLRRRRSPGIGNHGGIPVGGGTLRKLFQEERFQEILQFLKDGTSMRPPFEGQRLVVPGKPDESAFYLQLTNDNGVMIGRLDSEEIDIVRNWIISLAADIPPPPPPPADPAMEMKLLLVAKRVQGVAMHTGIEASEGRSLSDLFGEKGYDRVLEFLQTGKSIIPPFAGKPLIVPGQPQASAFYLQITDPDGIMSGQFNVDEIAIVERWILSLAKPQPKPLPAEFKTHATLVASGLNGPVFVTSPPGDLKRLFIAEQSGAIKILKLETGKLLATPFLKVADIAVGGERGLLGLAFHPDFENNGLLFVNCTNSSGATEIRSYQVGGTTDQAVPSTHKVILRIDQPFRNHNGGWIGFGPNDGYLYIATGDGGSANDPQNHGQRLDSMLGKLLRIDVDGDDFPADPDRNYAIPADNPFVGNASANPEIWAYGLRNPWRCSFDRVTGDLLIGDVGQNQREEIDFQPASSQGGENYGWRVKEGTLVTSMSGGAGPFTDPIHEYSHSDGVSVIGGYVYRGTQSPSLVGTYFFGEFTGRVWSGIASAASMTGVRERTAELLSEPPMLESLSTFGEDGNGEVYFATLSGDIYRIEAESMAVPEDRWGDVAKIRIHPAIGIARVGNAGFVGGMPTSPAPSEDYFIGPEVPFETSPPAGGYKKSGRIRRQAARFRLYAYDSNDHLIGEVTSASADITWTVELANKKASFRQFTGLTAAGTPRNGHVAGDNRSALEIKPGKRSISGPNGVAAFDGASFTDWNSGTARTVSNIYLGEIQTEDTGRLLVLGGEGTSQSPWNRPIPSFVNNDGWFDTMSDGPVTAKIQFEGESHVIEAMPAWVICTPPKFAPALRNVVTLYDVLFEIAVKQGWLSLPTRPSFRHDIYPILERALSLRWLLNAAGNRHDGLQGATPPIPTYEPADLFARLRSPHPGTNTDGMNMPQMFDDHNAWQQVGDRGLSLTLSMYETMRRWSIGEFEDDWNGEPPKAPTEITPAGLDQAALENCSGGGFYPGIECGWMLRDTISYIEPFRMDTTGLEAGHLTQQMAVPWQADFWECRTSAVGSRRVAWWPQQRPDDVFLDGEAARVSWVRDKISNHQDMVAKWHELGFVVDNGTRFVETERS